MLDPQCQIVNLRLYTKEDITRQTNKGAWRWIGSLVAMLPLATLWLLSDGEISQIHAFLYACGAVIFLQSYLIFLDDPVSTRKYHFALAQYAQEFVAKRGYMPELPEAAKAFYLNKDPGKLVINQYPRAPALALLAAVVALFWLNWKLALIFAIADFVWFSLCLVISNTGARAACNTAKRLASSFTLNGLHDGTQDVPQGQQPPARKINIITGTDLAEDRVGNPAGRASWTTADIEAGQIIVAAEGADSPQGVYIGSLAVALTLDNSNTQKRSAGAVSEGQRADSRGMLSAQEAKQIARLCRNGN